MCSRRPLATSLLLSLILLAPAVPRAQTDVYPELWVTDARVDGMAVLGDTLFVSGRFGRVGPPTGQLAVLDKQTGEPDLSLPRFDGLTAIGSPGVMTVVLDGQGGYYVGGDLRFADGTGYN